MLISFLKVMQALWPFLREVLLRNKGFKEAILENKVLSTLFSLLVVMFFAFLNASDIVTKQRSDLTQVQHEFALVQVRYEELQGTAKHLEQTITDQANSLGTLRNQAEVSEQHVRSLTALLGQLHATPGTVVKVDHSAKLNELRMLRERELRRRREESL